MEELGAITLRGRFQLLERIGQGAMGTVWRGLDVRTSRPVAIKLLITPNAAATTLFLREIEALAELRHPHIVGYVDHGLTENGAPYLAMEWLNGIDLQTHLEAHSLTSEEALQLARQALSALATAHGRGIVHRDLKPANIFLCAGRFDQIKLVDFGIVKRLLDAPKSGARLAVGTPLYMSPEQARGLPNIDGRSDIFSLGSVLYEALSGTPAFCGETALAVLAKVCVDDPQPLRRLCPKISAEFEKQIMGMLEKSPAQRPQDAEQLLHALSLLASSASREVTAFPDSLSMDEQRVVVVLMSKLPKPIRPPTGGDQLAPTDVEVETATGTMLPRSLTDAFGKMDAQVNQLVDGTLLVTCSGNSTASELAAKAARCALALRRHRSAAATAISMGKTVVRQGLPLGRLLDETSTRLANAEPGEISVDEDTAGLISRIFAVTSRSAKWLLVDDSYATPLPVSLSANERFFVGRESEMQDLEASFSQVIQQHRMKVLVYSAEAGVGKSRLAAEWFTLMRQRDQRCRIWRAQGDSLLSGSPFDFARQLVMNATSIQPETPAKARREIVTKFLNKGTRLEGKHASGFFLSELVGAGPTAESESALKLARSDPRIMAEQMALAFGDALRMAVETLPLVLLLDDLQWADAASVRLLNSAFVQAADTPCLVLGLARLEISLRHPKLWEGRNIERVTLPILSQQAAALLISQLTPTSSNQTAEWIAERADGNPFFIEEISRALQRRGKTQIPDAVLGTVQARLDDLPSSARLILRAASIFGRQFGRASLPSLLGAEERTSLDHWLDFLVKEEILQAQSATLYAFRQELTKEATYQSLTDGDRVLGHRLAGRWLEAQGDTPPSVLLEHFSRAFDGPKSCLLTEAAATQAYAAGDLEGALAFAERGHSFSPDPVQAGRLRLLEVRVCRWLGRVQAGWPAVQQAMKLLPAGGAHWFAAVEAGAVMLAESANSEELLKLSFETHDQEPIDRDAFDGRAITLATMAAGLLGSQFMQEGEAILQEVESVDFALLRPESRSRVFQVRANSEKRWGRLGFARLRWEQAMDEAIAAGDEMLEVDARNGLSIIFLESGLYDAASECLSRSLAFARRIRSPLFEGLALANVGYVSLLKGALGEADHAFVTAAQRFRGLGLNWLELGLGLYRAHLAVLQGDAEAARPFVQPFLLDAQLAIPYRPYALALAAQIELIENDLESALRHAEEGRCLMDDQGVPAEDGEMYLRLTLVETLTRAEMRTSAYGALVLATNKLRARAAEMNDAAMEAAFMLIPVHRRLFDLLAAVTCVS